MLTVSIIEATWNDWTWHRGQQPVVRPKPLNPEPDSPPATRADLESLSDEEIDRLRIAIKELRRSPDYAR
jgi:hypothetical protein